MDSSGSRALGLTAAPRFISGYRLQLCRAPQPTDRGVFVGSISKPRESGTPAFQCDKTVLSSYSQSRARDLLVRYNGVCRLRWFVAGSVVGPSPAITRSFTLLFQLPAHRGQTRRSRTGRRSLRRCTPTERGLAVVPFQAGSRPGY